MPANPGSPASFGPDEFAAAATTSGIIVSRETIALLRDYADALELEAGKYNLVSRASLSGMWLRHFWDSAQLAALISEDAKSLVDLGSGAGFPGLVLAILLRDRPGYRTVLYEATRKKARFLAVIAEKLSLAVEVRAERTEDAPKQRFDIVTARACAPLDRLLDYAQTFWGPSTTGLFPKGQSVESELTLANKSWRMELRRHPSKSDPSGIILEVRGLARVQPDRQFDR